MKDNTRKTSIDRKAVASLHALQSSEAEVGDNGFLETAQAFGSVVAHQHVLLPCPIAATRVEERQLWPVEEYECEVVVAQDVANDMGGQPWW